MRQTTKPPSQGKEIDAILRKARRDTKAINAAAADIETTLVRFDGENASIDFNVDWEHETVWASQRQMGALFGKEVPTINEHLAGLFASGEFERTATVRNFRIVRLEGGRSVSREIEHYNLDVILVVGYRVNGDRAAQFRRWASGVLKQYITKGFALDSARLDKDEQAREAAIAELRKLRTGDRALYKRVTDAIAKTSYDYQITLEENPQRVRGLFSRIQDTFHVAVTGKTAQELVIENADGDKPLVGMISFDGDPAKITKHDVRTGKNYLEPIPFRKLEILYEQLFLFAEHRILGGQHMNLAGWEQQLNTLLKANGYEAWSLYSSYKAADADAVAIREFAKYKGRLKATAAPTPP